MENTTLEKEKQISQSEAHEKIDLIFEDLERSKKGFTQDAFEGKKASDLAQIYSLSQTVYGNDAFAKVGDKIILCSNEYGEEDIVLVTGRISQLKVVDQCTVGSTLGKHIVGKPISHSFTVEDENLKRSVEYHIAGIEHDYLERIEKEQGYSKTLR